MIELVHAPKQIKTTVSGGELGKANAATNLTNEDPYRSQRIGYRISQAEPAVRDIYEAVRQNLQSLGDDIQIKEVQNYIAFKRIKNFACVEVYPQNKVVIVYLKVDPKTVELEEGFTRDVTSIGHFGTGNLEVRLRSLDELSKAHPLFLRSYEAS